MWQCRCSLLASVDQVRVDRLLDRKRTDTEKAVLRLQRHIDTVWNIVSDERRNAKAEIDVCAIL